MRTPPAPYDSKENWTTEDGHQFTSVPTEKPGPWKRVRVGADLIYSSGAYEIIGRPYGDASRRNGAGRRTYTVYRDGVELPLSFTGSLRTAKTEAVINADGRGRINVA